MRTRRLLHGYTALFVFLLAVQAGAGGLLLTRWRSQSLAEANEAIRDIASFSAAALDRTLSQSNALLKALPILLRDQIQEGQIAPLAMGLLKAQILQNEALRNVMIIDQTGVTRISASPDPQVMTGDVLAAMRPSAPSGLSVSGPVYNPVGSEWSILLSRRIELSDLGAVNAVASLSLPALATQIAPATARRGVMLSVVGQGRTIFQNLAHSNEIGASVETAEPLDPDAAALTREITLTEAPLTLRVALSPEIALEEWRHDASWIIFLGGVICLLEITAGVVAFALVVSRAKSKREMERATQELSASRRSAQAAADARGIFIANMNHELRTPLNAVIGFSEILTNELFGPIGNPRYRDYAADIHASGAHLLSLINDIIDFSTIDLGHRKLEPAPIDLPNALQDSMRLIRPQAAARSLRIEISGVRPDDWVLADARALRQVLVNILSNAIKFSPPEGLIRIVRSYPIGSNALEISIIDQGPGIPEAEIDKIGEQFYRTAAATESAVGGAGLGLSISMSLMNLMGGSIAVKSEVGVGTTMTLRLPKTEARVLEAIN